MTNMASFYLCSGDSEKNHPKWPYCKDAIPKQRWLHWIHKNGLYTPNSWSSLFHNKKESNTISCMICFNLLVLHSMFVLQMEFLIAFSFVKSSFLEHHMSFHIFLNAVLWLNKKHIWISWTDISNKSIHAGLALFSAVIFFILCFFYIPHSHSNIGFYWSILLFKLTRTLLKYSLTILQSQNPKQCLHKSCMVVCVFKCQWPTARMQKH